MDLNEEVKNKLISTYRTELFENDAADINEIDGLISDEDLKSIIMLNNKEMSSLIKKEPIDKEQVRKLFIANKNFYKIVKHRGLNIPGTSILMIIAGMVDYNIDKLYSELNVGAYYRPHRPR